ncbi:MAG: hypothetical protein KKD99_13480, partial [Proteobacteria bacterium]|nr:hypothetical protein [Pseudomonadota bacterium]
RQEGQRAELYSRITKGMSPVEVKKILGEPFHTEMGTSGFSTIYFDTWTYTNGNDDCIVRFQCSRSCRVIKLTIKKTK